MKKVIISLGFLFAFSNILLAQKGLKLTVKYNQEFRQYEVYAKSNFSQSKFTWGPSQISIVIPSANGVEKLLIRNVEGGTWEDNSIINSPESAKSKSFHGITTSGNITSLVEDNETLLFYFSLPSTVNSNMVRLYNKNLDPPSSASGMKGGDFNNSISDITGEEHFMGTYRTLSVLDRKQEKFANFDVNVYPNVVKENKFDVKFLNLSDDKKVIDLVVFDELGREVYSKIGTKSLIESETIRLPKFNNAKSLIVKFYTEDSSVTKRIIVENE